MRASGSDDMIRLVPPRVMNLEQALELIKGGRVRRVTPANFRLRKRVLAANRRK
jgi:GTP-binding protein